RGSVRGRDGGDHGLHSRHGQEPGIEGHREAAEAPWPRGRHDGRPVAMTMEEQRLSELLKRSVPEPPFELSADRVTVQHIDRSGRSWLMPVLAAAAVVLVAAAGVGLKATQHPSPASSAQQEGQVTLTPTAASTTAG